MTKGRIVHRGANLSRRQLLAGASAASVLLAMGSSGAFAQNAPIRIASLGNASKLKIRGDAVAKFGELHPDIPVTFEGIPSDSYNDKIATMIAGGTAPDVMTLGPAETDQYSSRGALASLEEFVPDILRADLFEKSVLDLGRVRGELYGVPIAVAIQGLGVNESALGRLNLGPLPENWDYKAFAEYGAEIHKADSNLYGAQDAGGRIEFITMYALSRGLPQFFVDDKLAMSVEEVADWFEIWDKMRKTGAAVPPDIQAQFTGTEWPNSPLVRGKAVFAHLYSQDISGGYQGLMEDKVGLVLPPSAEPGNNPGLYPQPTSQLVLNAKSMNKENAVRLIDWFVSDPESAKILGLISGPPASKMALDTVLAFPDLSDVDKRVLDYAQKAIAMALPAPTQHRTLRQIHDLLRRVNENIGFGAYSVNDGAKEFIEQGNQILVS